MVKHALHFFCKIPTASVVFMIGLILSGALLPQFGLQPPDLPEGADAHSISMYFALGSLLFGLALAFLARGIKGAFLERWFALSGIMWIAYGINNVIEGAIFSTFSATSSMQSMLYTGLSLLIPSIGQAGWIAAMFKPSQEEKSSQPSLLAHTLTEWFWRLGLAWFAFPVIYYAFGLVVYPMVQDYYLQGQFELALPTLGEILPIQLLRSGLFLLVSLPFILRWTKSRISLILSLGFALFVFVGGFTMLTTYWFAWQLRLYHGLEILADEFVYAFVLVSLFTRRKPPNESKEKHDDHK